VSSQYGLSVSIDLGLTERWIPLQQEMAWFEMLNTPRVQAFVTGAVYSPWSCIPIAEFRQHLPASMPLRNYPDLCHVQTCQNPVFGWDIIFATTNNRESVNPRPCEFANVIDAQAPYTIGCGCYSEGVNDDVNKYVWSTLHWGNDIEGPLKGASTEQVLDRMLVEYAAVLVGMPRQAEKIASIIKLLEENWKGDPVPLDSAADRLADTWEWQKTILPYHRRHNWRLSMLLFRLYFDTLLISRLRQERALMRDMFRACKEHGIEHADAALRRENLLSKPYYEPPIASSSFAENEALAGSLQDGFNIMSLHPGSTITHLYGQLMVMAASTYQQIGYQTSVGLGGQHRQRGAYLDLIWAPLSDVQYISRALQAASAESETRQRSSSLSGQEAVDLKTDLGHRLRLVTSGSVEGETLLWYASFGDESSCGLDGCSKPVQPIPVCEVRLADWRIAPNWWDDQRVLGAVVSQVLPPYRQVKLGEDPAYFERPLVEYAASHLAMWAYGP
jgi:hypothetical protein